MVPRESPTLIYRWVCLGVLFLSGFMAFAIRLAPRDRNGHTESLFLGSLSGDSQKSQGEACGVARYVQTALTYLRIDFGAQR